MPAKQAYVQDEVVVTPAQLRAARGLLNWTVARLAAEAGLALNTVRKAEDARQFLTVYKPNAEALRTTLENAGVVFIEDDTMGRGARLRERKEPSGRRRSVP